MPLPTFGRRLLLLGGVARNFVPTPPVPLGAGASHIFSLWPLYNSTSNAPVDGKVVRGQPAKYVVSRTGYVATAGDSFSASLNASGTTSFVNDLATDVAASIASVPGVSSTGTGNSVTLTFVGDTAPSYLEIIRPTKPSATPYVPNDRGLLTIGAPNVGTVSTTFNQAAWLIEDPSKGHAPWPATRFRGYTDAGTNTADQSVLYVSCGNSPWIEANPTEFTLFFEGALNDHSLNKGFLWRSNSNVRHAVALERSSLGMSVLNCAFGDATAANAMIRGNFKPPGLQLNRRQRIIVTVDTKQPTAALGIRARIDDTILSLGVSGGQPLWPVNPRANSNAYALGTLITVPGRTDLWFICTTAGTSAASEPAGYGTATDGGTVTDGSAVFTAGTPANLAKPIGLSVPGTGFMLWGTDTGGSAMGDWGTFWAHPKTFDLTVKTDGTDIFEKFFFDTIGTDGSAPLAGVKALIYLSGDDTGWKTGVNGDASPLNKGTVGRTLQRLTAYTVGQLVDNPTAPGRWLRCSTAGTTAATQPTTYGTVADNGTVTDGTAVFTSAFRFMLRPSAAARANSSAYTFAATTLITATGSSLWFRCTTAGTSAATQPAAYASAVVGQSITDGTAVFVAIEPATARVSSAAAGTSTTPTIPATGPTGMPTTLAQLPPEVAAAIPGAVMTFGDDFIVPRQTTGRYRFARGDINDPSRLVKVGNAMVAPNWGFHLRQFENVNLAGVNERNNTAGKQFYVRPGGDSPISANDFLTGTIEPGVLECHELQLNTAGTALHPNGIIREYLKPIPPTVKPMLRKGALTQLSAFGAAGQIVDFTCAGAILETNTWFGWDYGYYEFRFRHGRGTYPDTTIGTFPAGWLRGPYKGRVNQGYEIDVFEILGHTPNAEPSTGFPDGSSNRFFLRNLFGGSGGPNDPSGPEMCGPWITMGLLLLPPSASFPNGRAQIFRNGVSAVIKSAWTGSPTNPYDVQDITAPYKATVARANSTAYVKAGGPVSLILVQGRSYFCTTAGMSASVEPAAYATATNPGDQVTDGTAVFTLSQDDMPFHYAILNMAGEFGFGFPNAPDTDSGKTSWPDMWIEWDYVTVWQGTGHRYITGFPGVVTTL